MQYLKDGIRKNILENARDEFYKLGYKKASLRVIAEKSYITVGNIYRYFTNKEDLLDEVLKPLKSLLDGPLPMIPNSDNLDFLMDQVMDYVQDHYKELKIVSAEPIGMELKEQIAKAIGEWMVANMGCESELAKIISETFVRSANLIIRDNNDDLEKTRRYLKKLITIFFITGTETGLYQE